ncbi:MAG TPA: 4-(cytidine 5'-diphospho)-2-C-methyl-D-erythritol kinase [Mariprofundaceae bacterium]|nr:4-(cytidine 5'-diphospho)-2-C-methyl-D-erythritol kinase [Mariprofundaceae bacterium]
MVELPAPAKVNLNLRITGVRPDGHHLLDTRFAYVDSGDLLMIEPSDALRVTCSDPHLEGENNLVFRVLAAMRQAFGIRSGLQVHVQKRLPEQAGLGGGSSDAATAILAANEMWGLKQSRQALIDFATPFGADIPCFLFGHASRAAGVGERLARLDIPLPTEQLLLAHPGVGLSTAAVFGRFDAVMRQSGQLTPDEASDTIRAESRAGDMALGDNDLEAVACELCAPLARLLSILREAAAKTWMSGSGTACAALLPDRKQAEVLAARLHETGSATWSHVGRLMAEHPLAAGWETAMNDWGVAKW